MNDRKMKFDIGTNVIRQDNTKLDGNTPDEWFCEVLRP